MTDPHPCHEKNTPTPADKCHKLYAASGLRRGESRINGKTKVMQRLDYDNVPVGHSKVMQRLDYDNVPVGHSPYDNVHDGHSPKTAEAQKVAALTATDG